MDHLKFVIESSEAETMAKKLGFTSVLNLLPFIARSSQKLARIPISRFAVAAVGLATDGRIFVGVNVEFPGLPLHHSIHAEQFLITNISNHPDTQIQNVVVSAYPCGHCRQFLQEIRGAPDIQILVLDSSNKIYNFDVKSDILQQKPNECPDFHDGFLPLSHFLPHRFGPDDLLPKDVPLVLENRDNNLVLKEDGDDDDNDVIAKNGVLCNGFSSFDERQKLVSAALDAANKSHALYSNCPSGVALVDKNGRIYKGSYMESAAYNPSMGPAQAAIVAYMAAAVCGDGGDVHVDFAPYDIIVGAVLVELEDGIVRQEDTVRLFFKAVSPKCEFHVFHCQKSG